MPKDDQNPTFAVWLSAYGKRLIEITRTCEPQVDSELKAPRQSPDQNDSLNQLAPKPE